MPESVWGCVTAAVGLGSGILARLSFDLNARVVATPERVTRGGLRHQAAPKNLLWGLVTPSGWKGAVLVVLS